MTIVLFIAAITLACFAGAYLRDKAHKEEQAEQFGKYISRAIDTVERKGLAVEGASESIASNIWSTLVCEKDTLVGQEDVLASQLKDILQSYQ